MRKLGWIATFLVWPAVAPAAITRGPLLGDVTQDSITIRWFTDQPALGQVLYGFDPQDLTQSVTETTPATDHEVRLAGLAPSTLYYFAVASGTDLSAGEDHYFTTAPTACEPFSFVVVGDTRGATPFCDNFTDWRNVAAMIDGLAPEMLLGTGDYTYAGEQSTCWDHWFDAAAPLLLHTPFFPAIGNHDYDTQKYTNEANVGLVNFARWFAVPPGPETGKITTYFAFTFGNSRFIVFDTYKDRSPGSPQLLWIEAELAAAQADSNIQHVFVADHATFEGTGSFCVLGEQAQKDNRAYVEPLLEQYQADATFVGHEHSYQRAEKNGVHHVLTGGGGSPLENTIVNCHTPYCTWDQDSLVTYDGCTFHAVLVAVDGPHVTYTAIAADGTTVLDSWESDHWAAKSPSCTPTALDAGVPDAPARDAPAVPDALDDGWDFDVPGENPLAGPPGGGCGCAATPGAAGPLGLLLAAVALALVATRRRG